MTISADPLEDDDRDLAGRVLLVLGKKVTAQLEQIFHDVVRGKHPKYAHWLTPAGIGKAV